mmetsp:Transcript_49153/g.110532  ORF Transcript_49153/g.110532 Transcript_49153/m.110532 type:complete len:116 (-) Transcript_49153:720-1067(-)
MAPVMCGVTQRPCCALRRRLMVLTAVWVAELEAATEVEVVVVGPVGAAVAAAVVARRGQALARLVALTAVWALEAEAAGEAAAAVVAAVEAVEAAVAVAAAVAAAVTAINGHDSH